MNEIFQYYPEKYTSAIRTMGIRPRLSDAQIKSALAKIYTKGMTAKISLEKNNIAVINGMVHVHYRKSTCRDKSEYPWYSVSKSKLKELKESGIEVCCLFFKNYKGDYLVYYKKWNVDEIMDMQGNPLEPWTYEEGRELYRWNPQRSFDQDSYKYKMNLCSKKVAKGNI